MIILLCTSSPLIVNGEVAQSRISSYLEHNQQTQKQVKVKKLLKVQQKLFKIQRPIKQPSYKLNIH